MSGNFDFSLDLPYGEEAEAYVAQILSGVVGVERLDVEVKRDDAALATGNIYLEFEQLPRGKPPWRRSGLATTQATHFAVVLGSAIVVAPVASWKWVGNKYGTTRATEGENPTRGRVVPLVGLVKRLSEAPF